MRKTIFGFPTENERIFISISFTLPLISNAQCRLFTSVYKIRAIGRFGSTFSTLFRCPPKLWDHASNEAMELDRWENKCFAQKLRKRRIASLVTSCRKNADPPGFSVVFALMNELTKLQKTAIYCFHYHLLPF